VLKALRDEAATSAALAIRTSPEALATGAGPEVRFVWVGSGRLEAGLRRGLERLEPGVREGLVFLPWAPRPEFLEALSRATVYLHTARWEGLSLAILEAMAVGTPVVVRRGPGCHEVVEETGCGVVARDAKEAADAVLALLADASARRALASRGRAAVRSTYNLERLVSDLAALYETTEGR
jgi:glycosyltransferase involved in cell wall biosynthesis